jgi:glucose/arabinose dehydrogenase
MMKRTIQPPVLFVGLMLLGLLTIGLLLSSGSRQSGSAAALAASPYLDLSLVSVASGFNQPTVITHAGDGRLFIVEQAGVIRIIDENGSVLPDPFLDIQAEVESGFYEQGMLGLAFHPDYASNGYFYVYYNELGGDSLVVRYTVEDGDENTADPSSAFPIISIEQPYPNNNGGDIHFGPDGYLYIALGDGGAQGDPDDRAQDGSSLLGKLLRIDVDGTTPDTNYQIPPDNPFIGDSDVLDEIWALGLRNPWRFSFDRATGDLYLSDVGLSGYEEINFQSANSPGGENYGWRCYEGFAEHNLDECGPEEEYTFPAHAYPHFDGNTFLGCSVTGGFVYRGHWSPALIGQYIFGDYCSGNFWALSRDEQGDWQTSLLGNLLPNVSSFGEGANGELYATGHSDGTIYRLKATPTTPDVSLSTFATGLTQPVAIVNSGTPGDERIFVVQQPGQIRVVQPNGTVLPTPFLNIAALVNNSGNERGLLGLVFHPDYAENGYFYVNYTNLSGDTQIARYSVDGDNPNIADPNSALLILNIGQDFANHNGGDLHFGPDGYLYIGMGDGGSGGDPNNRSQTMSSLLGKMLRIDVDPAAGLPPNCGTGTTNYSIPADNPYVGVTTSCDEIWAPGVRNPWRFSFDALLGDMYIADVGQNVREEINWQPAASPGGENYGWRCYEGSLPYNTSGCGPASSYTFPVHDYPHTNNNCSVTGGYVYRGGEYPMLWGHYVYADYCSGRFYALHPDGDGGWQNLFLGQLITQLYSTSSFGQDIHGEMYVSSRSQGIIYRIQEDTPPPPPTPTPTETVTPEPTETPTVTPEPPDLTERVLLPLIIRELPPTATPTPTATQTPLPTDTPSPTATATETSTPTVTPTDEPPDGQGLP